MTTYRLPFPNPNLADGFGSLGFWEQGRWVKRARPHQGVDFPQAAGSRIVAIADAMVADVEHSPELGWITVLRHERTKAERAVGLRAVFSFYCHQSTNPGLARGWSVPAGSLIGHVGVQGRNGTAATGAHLHLAMSHDVTGGYEGRVFDPVKFINARRSAGVQKVKPPKRYLVKPKDNLTMISRRTHVSIARLMELNGIRNPDVIHAGVELRLA